MKGYAAEQIKPGIVGWNVDTQVDFMRPDGKLYIQGSEAIEPNLERLTKAAENWGIRVINTADWHNENTAEISDNPDFSTTYPEHCMQGTPGAEYVPVTQPTDPSVTSWEANFPDFHFPNTRNIVLYKDAPDIFEGNPHTDHVLTVLHPEKVLLWGVATDVCDRAAVLGLRKRGIDTYVVEDAIKGITAEREATAIAEMKKAGAHFITTDQAIQYMRQ